MSAPGNLPRGILNGVATHASPLSNESEMLQTDLPPVTIPASRPVEANPTVQRCFLMANTTFPPVGAGRRMDPRPELRRHEDALRGGRLRGHS